jgi:hypothetical protein
MRGHIDDVDASIPNIRGPVPNTRTTTLASTTSTRRFPDPAQRQCSRKSYWSAAVHVPVAPTPENSLEVVVRFIVPFVSAGGVMVPS